MDEKKIIKMEKDVVSNTRLQSLKLPRDLSLGLTKPKKQYQPNLNVSRNKDKTKEFLKKLEKRKEKPMRNDHQQRFKNDKSDSKRFVQSDGVFSHGAGDVRRPNLNLTRNYHRDTNSTNNLIKPTINRNNWQTNNVKNHDFLLDEISNYDDIDDDDDDDEKSSFHALKLTTIKMKQLKTDLKTESDTQVDSLKSITDLERIPEPFNSDKYDDEQPAICLLKLPDSFAGKGLSDDPNCKKLFDYPLDNMLEGQIGKLLLHKSGRMQIQIGKMHYHLEQEIINEAKEELATVVQNDNGDISLALLGNITHDFVMFPDYDQF